MSSPRSNRLTVIVGAGPYGLSLAAHLREAGLPFRIFGEPMKTWKTQMPETMKLKSDGFASNLSAGIHTSYTLADFCREHNRVYGDRSVAIALEDFIDYGEEFARRFVPTLERQNVTHITREGAGFRVTLADGETFSSSSIVLATGVSLYPHIPSAFAHLPPDRVSHTANHRRFDRFAGQRVAVLGRGASSLNAAALLHETGARVTLISRRPKIWIYTQMAPGPRPLRDRVLHPGSPLGYSKRSWLWSHFPVLFHTLPDPVRRAISFKHLGPSAGFSLQGRIEGHFPIFRGCRITAAQMTGDSIALTLEDAEHRTERVEVDHIIVGTGFHIDVARLAFLDPALRAEIATRRHSPRLKRSFESSARGVYFIGPSASSSLGPLLKFVAGAAYAATRVTRALRKSTPGSSE